MNIKVGDRVRIKSKEQLLNDNWFQVNDYLVSDFTGRHSINPEVCGQIFLVDYIDDSDSTFRANCYEFLKCAPCSCWFDMCVIDEVVEHTGNTGDTVNKDIEESVVIIPTYKQLQEENNRLQNAYDLTLEHLRSFKEENERLYKMKRDLEDYIIKQGWQEYVGEENKKTVWHKVADGDFPEKDKQVLCYTQHNDYTTGYFTNTKPNGNVWDLENDMWYREPQWVIAWMELPKYEGE